MALATPNHDDPGIGRLRQQEIYIGGVSGQTPPVPASPRALREAGKAAMTEEGFAYIDGGAGQETTMDANRAAFERWRIVPRMLRDVERRDPGVTLFGRRLPSPFVLAPIGVLEDAHKDADLAVAKAAASEGVPYLFSSQASVPMETCAEAMGDAPRWFQLYWSKSNALVESFVRRAESCGCEALVLTLDTTLLGWRTRDIDLAYLPFLRGKGIAQYTSDPVFRKQLKEPLDAPSVKPKLTPQALGVLAQTISNYPGGTLGKLASGRPREAVRRFVATYSRPSLTWDDLAFLRSLTSLPILLKGILHPDDAREAVRRGMDGVIVSNHGGRQVDGAIASLDALPAVVEAVDGAVPVLLDSGVRSGADAFKALALGAAAVGIGRPYAYALAAGGEAGVRTLLRNLQADFDLTMGLSGCTATDQIGPDALKYLS